MVNLVTAVVVAGGGFIIWLLILGLGLLERAAQAAERAAAATELTALYTREICWRTHDAAKIRNGVGELMRWQDPAEIDGVNSLLADAAERAERKRRREQAYGPDLKSHPGTDVGPEAEAIKAEAARWNAEFAAKWGHIRDPGASPDGDPEP